MFGKYYDPEIKPGVKIKFIKEFRTDNHLYEIGNIKEIFLPKGNKDNPNNYCVSYHKTVKENAGECFYQSWNTDMGIRFIKGVDFIILNKKSNLPKWF